MSEQNKAAIQQIFICRSDDRIIYVERNEEFEVVGLNFMQGSDDLNHFEPYLKTDEELTICYLTVKAIMHPEKNLTPQDEIELMNNVIWRRFEQLDNLLNNQ